ncbi:MAG: hypothetical protein HYV02_05010 [Deltaproteobacteria bacterium]|nr:hypothetical protein [Deltaproteobacteria bacterium]
MFGLITSIILGAVSLAVAIVGTGYSIYSAEEAAEKQDAQAEKQVAQLQRQRQEKKAIDREQAVETFKQLARGYTEAMIKGRNDENTLQSVADRHHKQVPYRRAQTKSAPLQAENRVVGQFNKALPPRSYGKTVS